MLPAPELRVEYLPLAELLPYARNMNAHSDAHVAELAASIKEFGWTVPVLVDKDNVLVAGHGRVLAARKLGLEQVPCIRRDHWSETQVKAYRIADNRLPKNASVDISMLKLELEEIRGEELNLNLLGFNDAELAGLLDSGAGVTDPEEEWQGMPEFEDDGPCHRKVVVNFDCAEDAESFFHLIGQDFTDKTKSVWFPLKERRKLEGLRWTEGGDDAASE